MIIWPRSALGPFPTSQAVRSPKSCSMIFVAPRGNLSGASTPDQLSLIAANPGTDQGASDNQPTCQTVALSLFGTAPPEWEQKIQDTYLPIYDSLFWECKARGKPRPWYTWLKNGERLGAEVSKGAHIKTHRLWWGNCVTNSDKY